MTDNPFWCRKCETVYENQCDCRKNHARARKIKLLSFYSFPGAKGSVDLSGVWETTSVDGLNTKSPEWTLTRILSAANDSLVGQVAKVPQIIIERFGFRIRRSAIFGG